MKTCRKYSDFARYFTDAEYVARRLSHVRSKVVKTQNGCLELSTAVTRSGYPRVSFGREDWHAHRLIWLIEHGDVGGLVIDHRCRNKLCVNLDHLEAVSNSENVRRARQHYHNGKCAAGHDLVTIPQRPNARHCPKCKSIKAAERYRQRRA